MDILDDPGLGLDEVAMLEPGGEGTTARLAADVPGAQNNLLSGMTLSEILRPYTSPEHVEQLSLLRL